MVSLIGKTMIYYLDIFSERSIFSMERYYRFSRYLKERFGCKVYKISVDAGFSCPNLDGTLSRKGCIFCDNRAFSPAVRDKKLPVEHQIAMGIEYGEKRYSAERFLVYFQPYSNTYASVETLEERYNVIKRFGHKVVGLCIGTRPDCIDREKLSLIESYTRDYEVWIEYGLQSIHDSTLNLLNRNHSYADFLRACELTREKKNIKICAHVIIGLPGEEQRDIIKTAQACGRLKIDGIKIHPMHIVKNTLLQKMFDEGNYKAWEFDRYIDTVSLFITALHPTTVIHRITAECKKQLLVAPVWLNDKEKLLQAVEQKMEKEGLLQGQNYVSA